MLSFEMNDRKKIGIGLTGFGVFFTFLGVIFLFDKGLLAMGNILFLSGLGLTIGLKSTMQFFMKPQNFKGTFSFGIGFFFVVIGWPILGMILEAYGFIILFSGFLPTLVVFLQRIPLLGWVLQLPFIRSILNLLFLLLVSTIPITGQAGDVYRDCVAKSRKQDVLMLPLQCCDSWTMQEYLVFGHEGKVTLKIFIGGLSFRGELKRNDCVMWIDKIMIKI